jgi:glutamate synthase domain-containing protein 2/glutamate synthase domain-containing protein 1/glutamate synthase domain-containing protein 3
VYPIDAPNALPSAQGLYDPSNEHDACGLGFVVNIDGTASHDIILKGLQILKNLAHRGACGCDSETGDGAGVLIQIPHAYFVRETANCDFALPEAGEYGVAMCFLPVDRQQRLACEGLMEKVSREEGLAILGWRDMPVGVDAIGRVARASQPYIEQFFVGRPAGIDDVGFERKLYVIRKRVESLVAHSDMREKNFFYLPSFSSRTIIYKGLLLAQQIGEFYNELLDPETKSALCMVHQRFSTNTFPTWQLAHPFRYLCHNGEINTLRGNVNWMNARQFMMSSPHFDDIEKLFPIIQAGVSDSAALDNAVEMLSMAGRSLPHVMAMLIPEAWDADGTMSPEKRAFYEYHASLMEPWDGPAAVAFTDGRVIGATLDRNGLRPARYLIIKGGLLVMASETGVLSFPPEDIEFKGRLQPGKMLLVDLEQGRLVPDEEIKHQLATRQPYGEWIKENQVNLDALPEPSRVQLADHETMLQRQRCFGYTDEDIRLLLTPMAADGQEAVGSMGIDTPLACLSDKPQLLFHYFKQLFAQVTNPPIDPIREELVMSLTSYIGVERNILAETPQNCHTVRMPHAVLTNRDLEKLRRVSRGDLLASTLPTTFSVHEGEAGLKRALDGLCRRASLAIKAGYTLLILSDRGIDEEFAPIPSLLALTAVHNHLVREGTRMGVALIIESGEPREVMHFALLIGYGASAINPYLALETIEELASARELPEAISAEKAVKNYLKAVDKGLLKIFSKMGISTLQSYRGAQVFEAVGLNKKLVEQYFTGTASRIEGIGLDVLAEEAAAKHRFGFRPVSDTEPELAIGGDYQYRINGERHLLNPASVSKLRHAVRSQSYATFQEYSKLTDEQSENLYALRGLMKLKTIPRPLPIEEVEPASEIVKRFATGAMSFGSISAEAHETLAIATNRIGARSNTGEGGEDEARFVPLPNGDSKRSAIKQVASGRFGVTTNYLVNAQELQIKVAQGAKPGEGGQLPGDKVDAEIARVRHSTPGVGLISPPPHHDIYSIEDLSQLIYDLKNVNPAARVSVKLVAEVGVGTVAAGVSKAHADVVLISGYDGGTGAAPLTSIKHAGVPWELGLAETQQVLVMNDLRSRIRVQVDGKLQTGRDVAIAALLGAEEFGFSTAPLVALGCIMMRKCHLNTCPVGIATQNPQLRKKFDGQPEHVINFFFFIAEEVREWMAKLGFRNMDEMIGRVDMLEMREAVEHWKARGLDFSSILYNPQVPGRVGRRCTIAQDHELQGALDHALLEDTKSAVELGQPVELNLAIRNVHRTVGAMLSGSVARVHGSKGLPDDTIRINFSGSAGQSFGAFLAKGITLSLEGDTNDYTGKGLSGGKIIVYPPKQSRFKPEENILVGNTVLYGATSGEAYFNGVAGERFAVRNSGATAVVEGTGDHACEYMTNGTVVVLGATGRNFAAGMSGGLAYVYDPSGDLARVRCNTAGVDLEPIFETEDILLLESLLRKHVEHTDSPLGRRLLNGWPQTLKGFVKVFPHEYKRVLKLKKVVESERGVGGLRPSSAPAARAAESGR